MFNLKLTLFTLIYYYTTTKFLDVLSALLPKTKLQFKEQGKTEQNKFAIAKPKTLSFLLRWRRATTGPATAASRREEGQYFTRASDLRIRSNDWKKNLRQEDQAWQVIQAPWAGQVVLQKEMWLRGWGNQPAQNKKAQTKRFARPWISPGEDDCPKEGERWESAQEVRQRTPRIRQARVPKNDYRRRRGASNEKSKAGKADGMESREHQWRANQAWLVYPRRLRHNRGTCPSSSPFGTTAEKPVKSKIEGVGPCTF